MTAALIGVAGVVAYLAVGFVLAVVFTRLSRLVRDGDLAHLVLLLWPIVLVLALLGWMSDLAERLGQPK
jgi:hypothetical protein